MTSTAMTASVVICTYTEERWDTLVAAVQSARAQKRPADELVIVIDHNDSLLRRTTEAFPDAEVVENRTEARGIGGARNAGARHARGDIVAYLDDDAVAEPQWLQELLHPYKDPSVMGTGSQVVAAWSGGEPSWFPEEFGWVVGCSFLGQPDVVAPVRNFIANGMSLRKDAFAAVGPFLNDVGRIGSVPLGCEETELCIRVGKRFPHHKLLHVPTARVIHDVPATRGTIRYFLLRCFAEGLSKEAVSRCTGPRAALATEGTYTLKVLPRGVARGLGKAVRGHVNGATKASMILVGLFSTVAGYICGRFGLLSKRVAIWGDRGIRGRNVPKSVVVHD